jgi:hypothetical protein
MNSICSAKHKKLSSYYFSGQKSKGIKRGKLKRLGLEQGCLYCTPTVYSSSDKSLHITMSL